MTVSWPAQDDLLKWMSSDLRNWGRWGKDDQVGAVNMVTNEKRAAAARLVKSIEEAGGRV